jgi:glycosyltransferase involved in cell wall biosynthesis
MKVVFINAAAQLGGAEAVLLDMLASLRAVAPDIELHLIVPSPGPLLDKARALGVFVTIVGFPSSIAHLGDFGASGKDYKQRLKRLALIGRVSVSSASAIVYAWKLRRVLRQLRPDIVHTNGLKMHIFGLLAKPKRKPLIWHIHDYISARPIMARLIKHSATHCAAAVAISRSVANDLRALCGERVPIHVIENVVDVERFTPDGTTLDLDRLAGLHPAPAETIRVGLIGTFARWKGHEAFLRALAQLDDELPVRGYIIGGAIYQTEHSQYSCEELKRLAFGLGIAHKVGFTGLVADVPSALRALDIVVHASTQPEPFGLVIIEAMACGRAVIASRSGGAAEIFTDGEDALGHAPGDSVALAELIARLVRNAELRQRLAKAGRRTAEVRFNRARFGKQLLQIYLSCLMNNSSDKVTKFIEVLK